MLIKKKSSDQIDLDTINDLCGTSFFASKDYLDLWSTMNGKGVYITAFQDSDIIAIMPGVEFGIAPIKRFQSMPDGTYGKIFYNNAISDEIKSKINDLILNFLLKSGYTKIDIYDYENNLISSKDFDEIALSTHIIDITAPDWLPPDKKIQSELRKAEREKVNIGQFDIDIHFEKFIDLMKQTEARHGRKPKYSDEFYKSLAEIALRDDRLQWLWCEHEGEAVSSHINIYENEMLLNWQVFFDKDFSFLKANQFMILNAVKNAQSKGCKYFNMGASPEEAAGLIEYKQKYGSYEYTYKLHRFKSLLGKVL